MSVFSLLLPRGLHFVSALAAFGPHLETSGHSWEFLGRSWEALGTLLGGSSDALGTLLGRLLKLWAATAATEAVQ